MSVSSLGVLAGVLVVAAFIQGSSGVGFALMSAPVIGLTQPSLLPTTMLLLMIPLNAYIAWRERGHVDRGGAGWITVGRLAGTGGGFALLVAVPVAHLNLLIGAATVLAALTSLAAPRFVPGRRALVAGGAVLGVTETATGIGGPALALLLQHKRAPVLRSTVALCFLVGEVLSVALLLATGKAHAEQVRIALMLLPALAVGGACSHFVHHRVDGRGLRIGVLLFALVSGVALLLRA